MRLICLLLAFLWASPLLAGPLSRAAELADEWASGGVPMPAETVADGWYAVEALHCLDCPTARPELLVLQKAGWQIELVDESHPVVALAKPEQVPAVVWIRGGEVAGKVTWPFDRWDVGVLAGRPRPQPVVQQPIQQPQAFMYLPSGSSVWQEARGGTSFQHLVGHGYNPAILRNTPPQYYGALHGDAHEGRRSRVLPVQQRSVSYQRVGYGGCPTGSG